MYKIYIADDETIIRKGLINGIDWAALNCQVIGSASDGKKAYNEILRLRPDILLTDIKMPLLDGLEMIALLRRQLSDLYIIVITGYSEFSFAQRAVKLGVYDFILKPIDIDYLCKVILNIENKIDDCRSGHSAVSLYSNFRGELSLSEAQALWNAVFSPSSSDFTVWEEEGRPGRHLPFCQCVILQIDDYFRIVENMTLEEQEELEGVICKSIAEALKEADHVYSLARGNAEFLFVLFSENIPALESHRQKLLLQFRKLLDERLNCTATAGIGTILSRPGQIRQSYLEAEEALQHKFLYGNSSDIFFASRNHPSEAADYDYISSMQTIVSSIVSGNPTRAIEEAGKSFSPGSRPVYASMHSFTINNIIFGCIELLSAVNLSLYEVFPDFSAVYKELISSGSDPELHARLAGLIRQVSNLYSLSKNSLTGSENPIVSDAKAYIEKHYSDCRLHLSHIAEALSVSSCYLSNIFKQETGKTYIDFLTSVRIKKAKEFLADPQVKVYEVCYLAGYDNPTYFSTLFKRRTGCTPTEYRNRLSPREQKNSLE